MATRQASTPALDPSDQLEAAKDALDDIDIRPDHPTDFRRGIAQIRGRLDSLAGSTADDASANQTTLPQFSFQLTAESPFCPFCGERDANPIHHVLETHPDVINDRLAELVKNYEKTITFASDGETELFDDDLGEMDTPTRPVESPGQALDIDSSGPPTCGNCGTEVSKDYLRVFSSDDDNQELQHCYACKSRTERY